MVRNRFMATQPCDSYVVAPPDARCAPDEAKEPFPDGNIAAFTAHPQELPLANASMDAVMLHHALECADDPRAVLREVSRVLAPGGRLVLTVFNPASLWGLGNLGSRCRAWVLGRRAQGLARLLAPPRLLDWLALLDIEVDSPLRYCGYGVSERSSRPRVAAMAAWLRRRQAPIGNTYIISATKRRCAGGTRLSATQLNNPKLAPVTYPKLAAWNRLDQDR